MTAETKSDFIRHLKKQLEAPLPGRTAQEQMAPRPIDESRFRENPHLPAKPGGVMILLFERDGDWWIPLMKRPEYNGHHSGQVSFPGGKMEPEDIDLTETALRETKEEIGIDKEEIDLLGSLTELFIVASNFKVLPTVGVLNKLPQYRPDHYEVESILELSISQLKDEQIRGVETMHFGQYTIHSPYYEVEGHRIWGATAMILSELSYLMD
jgi:8-oxo-dGTP pyrophosphatase MutT (NUDIX family)